MKKKPGRYFLYLLLRLIILLFENMPRRAALAAAKGMGCLTFYLVRRQRDRTLEHLRFAWDGQKSPDELKAIAKQVFENLAMTGMEVIQFKKMTESKIARLVTADEDPYARVDEALRSGKGVIILTGHIGNWELIAAFYAILEKYSGAVVGRKIYYEPYNRTLIGLRESVGVKTIYRDAGAKEILQVLSRNEILGMLADQDVDSVDGIFVDFFGQPAYTPTAPVRIALAKGTPIIPAAMIRKGWNYQLMLGETINPADYENEAKEEAVRMMTERWSKVIEGYIRQFPGQWGWMHHRWKTRNRTVVSRD